MERIKNQGRPEFDSFTEQELGNVLIEPALTALLRKPSRKMSSYISPIFVTMFTN